MPPPCCRAVENLHRVTPIIEQLIRALNKHRVIRHMLLRDDSACLQHIRHYPGNVQFCGRVHAARSAARKSAVVKLLDALKARDVLFALPVIVPSADSHGIRRNRRRTSTRATGAWRSDSSAANGGGHSLRTFSPLQSSLHRSSTTLVALARRVR